MCVCELGAAVTQKVSREKEGRLHFARATLDRATPLPCAVCGHTSWGRPCLPPQPPSRPPSLPSPPRLIVGLLSMTGNLRPTLVWAQPRCSREGECRVRRPRRLLVRLCASVRRVGIHCTRAQQRRSLSEEPLCNQTPREERARNTSARSSKRPWLAALSRPAAIPPSAPRKDSTDVR